MWNAASLQMGQVVGLNFCFNTAPSQVASILFCCNLNVPHICNITHYLKGSILHTILMKNIVLNVL